jgi:uncharacterized glyoxalase superfamily protein PhnB
MPAYVPQPEVRPMTNLENLRKQAKQFVRWHRERHWTVAEAIRTTLPRYRALSDGEVFATKFQLADAQELLARRAGFRDWAALVAASPEPEDSTEEPSDGANRPRLLAACPFVFVRDIAAGCAYYTEKLGFELSFSYGEPAFYAEVERDGIRLCVRHTDEAVVDPSQAKREQIVLASLEVTDAKALFLEFQGAGVTFSQVFRTEPYGTRTFVVEDPYGNRIHFFDTERHPARREAAATQTERA